MRNTKRNWAMGMTTLEERRHQLDMQQIHKILHRPDRVDRK
jgi:hypothetical protein